MRELTSEEIELVSGVGTIGDKAADIGRVGSMVGVLATNTIKGAIRGGAAGALLGASYGFGLVVGGEIYNAIS